MPTTGLIVYYCPDCDRTHYQAAVCDLCGQPTKRVERMNYNYFCAACQTYSDTPECPTCETKN